MASGCHVLVQPALLHDVALGVGGRETLGAPFLALVGNPRVVEGDDPDKTSVGANVAGSRSVAYLEAGLVAVARTKAVVLVAVVQEGEAALGSLDYSFYLEGEVEREAGRQNPGVEGLEEHSVAEGDIYWVHASAGRAIFEPDAEWGCISLARGVAAAPS